MVQLISLQKANGSWELDEDLTKILGTKSKDIKAANPAKVRCTEKQGEECVLPEVRNITRVEVSPGPGEK